LEFNFIWKTYGYLPLPPLFREREGMTEKLHGSYLEVGPVIASTLQSKQ
jgi:hypothetical protein